MKKFALTLLVVVLGSSLSAGAEGVGGVGSPSPERRAQLDREVARRRADRVARAASRAAVRSRVRVRSHGLPRYVGFGVG